MKHTTVHYFGAHGTDPFTGEQFLLRYSDPVDDQLFCLLTAGERGALPRGWLAWHFPLDGRGRHQYRASFKGFLALPALPGNGLQFLNEAYAAEASVAA